MHIKRYMMDGLNKQRKTGGPLAEVKYNHVLQSELIDFLRVRLIGSGIVK